MTMYSSYHRRTGRNAGGDLSGGFFVQTGGTGYKSAAVDSSSSAKSRRRKVLFAALYGSLGLLAVYTNGFDLRLPTSFADLRRQLTNCITNVYATKDEVVSLPPVPAQGSTYLPSYIKLCYEWMRREAQPNPATPYANLNVLENQDICVDWTAPHYAMMEIVASQILGTAIPTSGITYQHRCAEFRSNDEGLLGFDWTTFQTIYQEAAMGVDAAAIFPNGIDDLRTTCKAALQAYDPNMEKLRVRSRTAHHPFANPERSIMDDGLTLAPSATRTELTWLPATPDISNPRLAPISAVAQPLRNRFHTGAENWVGVTNAPLYENLAGTVIMVDNASREMDPAILAEYIPPQVSSISILASPLCVTSTLPTGTPCLDYVDQLLNYFTDAYPSLATNGPDGGPGVTSKIVPSTAAGMARPMTANTLLCVPNTLSCLPAALGKIPQATPPEPPIPTPPLPSTVLFDVPESVAAASFVDKVGRCGQNPLDPDACIKVVQLADPEAAATTEGTPSAPAPVPVPDTISGEPVADSFITAQDPVDYQGFDVADTSYSAPPPAPEPEAIAAQTPYESFVNATEEIVPPEVTESANLDPFGESSPLGATGDGTTEQPPSETVPTDEEIANAVDTGTPLDTNTPVLSTGEQAGLTAEQSTGELVADETNTPLETSFLGTLEYNDLIAERILSQGRIADANYVSSDPQIYCPTETPTGNIQKLDGGYTLADDGTKVVVSDTNGIVTFQSPVTITTLTPQEGEFVDPYTLETYTDKYITIFDAVLQDYVNVTDSVITVSSGNIFVNHSIGILYVDSTNDQGYLLLDAAAADLSDAADSHTLIEGTVIGVGVASVPLTEQGTTTITEGGGLEVTGQQNPDGYTTTTDPAEQPMAPENEYQMPPDTNSDGYVTRQLVGYDSCIVDIDTNPIHIRSHGGGTVTFDVAQVYKGGEISWVAVDLVSPSGVETCKKENSLSPGFDVRMAGFQAKCDANGEALVWIHIHDGSKAIGQSDIAPCRGKKSTCQADHTDDIPARCEPSQDKYANNKCHYAYVIDCNALPARRRLQSIGPSPPAIVTPVPTDKGRVLVQEEGEPLFGGSNVFKECTHRRTKRADGKVVFNNFKFGNGIQNAGLIVEGGNGNERGLRGPARNHNLEVINV